jgi:hypothetical protein
LESKDETVHLRKRNAFIINLDEAVSSFQLAGFPSQRGTARRQDSFRRLRNKPRKPSRRRGSLRTILRQPALARWHLTNLATIRKSIGRLKYIEEIEASPDYKKMGKQELAALNREAAKLRRNLEGILEMSQLPDALIIIDTTREQNAVNEARRLGIPTVAIVDTNADPEIIDYPIPGNDDAIRAIRVMLQKLVDAIVSASGEARLREEVEMAGVSA